ncbi:hypothetical protein E3O42_11855 [Cryobacterium adonitolivorans]|uniref:Uncharacterized protein n=1 Tax=Cryobacterium adonitolivorans TaxID=1259189 RepID=A0A4R8W323_9MICO|nr:hypothetical protein [Cryobacterium adonitolivorans]TFC00794.1 hypothetical protein E3O42_11855 [Cryobacterium adonitolivorans]
MLAWSQLRQPVPRGGERDIHIDPALALDPGKTFIDRLLLDSVAARGLPRIRSTPFCSHPFRVIQNRPG